LTADLFYRFFKHFGYRVTYVRNYTDIDDKIIHQAQKENTGCDEITTKYIAYAEKDYALALMEEPTHKTRVTEHLPEIIAMIESIIRNGKGYSTPSGDVYFAIDAFPTYGALSGKSVDDLQAGARVEINPEKKNPMDFALWKAAKPGEPAWDSPWGRGRPGWHIECSAMACKWLGPKMDLHHGGEDLVFPHHENEIAQSEAATGISPYVGCWVHNAFLTFSSEKMSKSLGNVVQARDFLAEYGGELARMIFLGVHYRSVFDFNAEAVDLAVTNLERVYEAKKIAEDLRDRRIGIPDPMAEQAWGSFIIDCDRAREAIRSHYANDLNTAGALSELYSLVREFNRALKQQNALNTPAGILAAIEFLKVFEGEIGAVIGIGRMRAESMLAHLERVKLSRSKREGKDVLEDADVEALIRERKLARENRDFKKSDEIRDRLLTGGVLIKDSPEGTTWVRK
jgi:cysteinyl-tRNA synthetase